jgi:uncharacterized membrane protein
MAEQTNSKIEALSGWILRIGVILSAAVILLGVALCAFHGHLPVERLRHATFEYPPQAIFAGLRDLRGQSVLELGIYLLLATPLMRVAASVVLFIAQERDWFYAMITAIVLALMLAGLLCV